MATDCKPPKARAPRRYRLPVEQIDGRRKAPLLWAETLDGILGAMDGEVTPPRLSLAHTAASLTVRLGKIDAAVAEGREPPADHVRLAGQLNRTLRSLGIVESAPLSQASGLQAGAGASSHQKNVPLQPIPDWIWESSRAKHIVQIGPEMVARVRASCITAIASRVQVQFFRWRLEAMDEAEEHWASLTEVQQEDEIDQRHYDAWRREDQERRGRGEESLPEPRNPHEERHTQAIRDKNSENIKSFASHEDSPRRDE